MVANEIQKRNQRAEQLRVLKTDDDQYFVESSDGKILYRVVFDDNEISCMCGDFVKNVKSDPNFRCKHILAVMNSIPSGDVQNGSFLEKIKPRLDERFVMNIKGKDFALYAGLLDMAHQKGLLKVEVTPIQYPTKDNGMEAICMAKIESKSGETFSEIGDANPKNVNKMIADHILRMAATRAKARALRDMTNIGMTCLEELGDLNDVIGSNTPAVNTQARKRAPQKHEKTTEVPPEPSRQVEPEATVQVPAQPEPEKPDKPKPAKKAQKADKDPEPSTKFSEAQKRAIFNLSRRRGISVEDLERMSMEAYGVKLESLNASDAAQFIRTLQTAA